MARVDGRVALITGAARGQGRAHAVRLAQEGADIIAVDLCRDQPELLYDQGTPEELAETAELVRKEGRRIVARAGDVRDQAAIDAAVADGLEQFGRIDILVSNAGIANQGMAHELTDAQWEGILGTNLVGAFHAAKAVIPSMMERESGSIVFVSSTVGLRGVPGMAHYGASKHGIQGLMLSLANELGPYGIRVNSVNPGTVNTPMALNERLLKLFVTDVENPTLDDAARAFKPLTLLPASWVEPEDVANAVFWLASDEARYVSGAAIPVDAGQLARA